MRQFLDIGTGLPTADNTHQVAQSVAPESRIVYVDNDPLVLAHARALLTSSPEGAYRLRGRGHGRTRQGSWRPRGPGWTSTQPVALMLMGIMGHFTDHDEALPDREPAAGRAAVRQLLRASTTAPTPTRRFNQAQQGYNDSGAVPYHLRSPEQFARLLRGPGAGRAGRGPLGGWRPDPDTERAEIYSYCGVGRKP